jgi:hypothetical protein
LGSDAETILGDEAGAAGLRQFRHGDLELGEKCGADADRDEVRLGEVAVVVRLFLRAHGDGFAEVGVEQARLLDDAATRFEDLHLALHFKLDRLFEEAERVEILHLGAGAELFRPF